MKLKKEFPETKRAVVKVNDGFSGDGNALFSYKGIDEAEDPYQWIKDELRSRLKMVAGDLTYESFMHKFREMGGIVEAFVEGEHKESPSVQCRVTPSGECEVISTHDQELGGESRSDLYGRQFPGFS